MRVAPPPRSQAVHSADLAEQFRVSPAMSSTEPTPGMVVSIDPTHPGKLLVSDSPYDKKVAVVGGALIIPARMASAALGRPTTSHASAIDRDRIDELAIAAVVAAETALGRFP